KWGIGTRAVYDRLDQMSTNRISRFLPVVCAFCGLSSERGGEFAREDEAQGAAESGLFAKGRGEDACGGEATANAVFDRFSQCALDQMPCTRDLTTNDNRFRTESNNEIRDSDAEVTCSLDQRGLCIRFACKCSIDNFDERDFRLHRAT